MKFLNSRPHNQRQLSSFLRFREKSYLRYLDDKLNAIARTQPLLRVVGYWGAGPKSNATLADLKSLHFVFGAFRAIEREYSCPVHAYFILTDTHADLNGYAPKVYNGYLKDICEYINLAGYSHVTMSELLNRLLFSKNALKKVTTKQSHASDSAFYNQGIRTLRDQIIEQAREIPDSLWNSLEKRAELETIALEHYRGEFHNSLGAKIYYTINRFESHIIQQHFTNCLFFTFNDPSFNFMLPNLPKLHIYTMNKKRTERPWFIEIEESKDKST